MAIYKPTNCTPFLTTFDCRVTNEDDIVFFECRIDSSNRNVVGYSVTVYDSQNNQVFPPSGAAADEHISYVADLASITGSGQATGGVDYLIQSGGYTNLNTGLNGSYLKFPFIMPNSFSGAGGGQTHFQSVNSLYYGAGGADTLTWYSVKPANPTTGNMSGGSTVSMSNGNSYKWVITLYQGDPSGNVPPTPSQQSYKYYDMLITNGQVMGSKDDRIQTVYSENVYIDYYIEPVKIEFTEYNSPTDWNGTVSPISGQSTTRTRIKNVDSTYGYLYPQIDDYSYSTGTITPQVAQGYRVYRMGNDPSVLTTTRMVNVAYDNVGVPFDWENMQADATQSNGSLKIYAPVGNTNIDILNYDGQDNDVSLVANEMSSTQIFPFDLIALNARITDEDAAEEEPVVRWFLKGIGNGTSTDSRILLNGQPVSGKWDGTVTDIIRPFKASPGDTSQSIAPTVPSSEQGSGSPYNGIYSIRWGGRTTVTLAVYDNSGNNVRRTAEFYEYQLNFDRVTDADSWGELMSKIVAVQGGQSDYVGQNMQAQAWDADDKPIYDSDPNGIINQTPIKFVAEQPIQLYNHGSDEVGANPNINKVGLIFYNGYDVVKNASGDFQSMTTTANKLYIRPFVGIERGMYWIEEGNTSDQNRRRFIIDYVDPDYWYVTFDGYVAPPSSTGTYPSDFDIVKITIDTRYQIKSYFRASDENPFDLYASPEIDINVYRNQNHTYPVATEENPEAGAAGNPKYDYSNATQPVVGPDGESRFYYFGTDGSYVLLERYGMSDIELVRVDRRSIWVEADYDQVDFISWRSAQWFVYDGSNTSGTLLLTSDLTFDGYLGYQIYGLLNNHIYTIVLVLETNSGLTLSKEIHIITDFETPQVDNFPFDLTYQCETHSVYMRFGLTGFVLPNTIYEDNGVDRYRGQSEDITQGTNPAIAGVTYTTDNDGQMIIDGTNPSFPKEGVTYNYISSTLDANTMATTALSSGEENGTFTFESKHTIDATNSWGNIVGFDYTDDETEDGEFPSENATVQIFIPNYNTTYTYNGQTYNYIDDKLLFQMLYQAGDFIGVVPIYDADTGIELSNEGIWGADAENKTTTPIIISGRYQAGSADISSDDIAIKPAGYEVIVTSVEQDNNFTKYSPVEDTAQHYKESGFDFLGNSILSTSGTTRYDSMSPLAPWSDRESYYGNYYVTHKDFDPLASDNGGVGYTGSEEVTGFNEFMVRTSSEGGTWENFEVIDQAPALWSDNTLSREQIILSGTRTRDWSNGGAISYDIKKTALREIECLDDPFVWDDGSGSGDDVTTDTDSTAYNVASASAKFWIDGDNGNGALLLYRQAEYSSGTGVDDFHENLKDYSFTYHVAVNNALVDPSTGIQIQAFREAAGGN